VLEDSDTPITPTPDRPTERDAGDPPAPRRRRAASRPAGPPATTTTAAKKASAKKAASKKTAKSVPATAAPTADPTETPAGAPAEPVQAAAPDASTPSRTRSRKKSAAPAAEPAETPDAAAEAPATSGAGAVQVLFKAPDAGPARPRRARKAAEAAGSATVVEAAEPEPSEAAAPPVAEDADADESAGPRRRRRRGGRGRRRSGEAGEASASDTETGGAGADTQPEDTAPSVDEAIGDTAEDEGDGSHRRRRRRRRSGTGEPEEMPAKDDPANTVVKVREPRPRATRDRGEVTSVKGSTRLEAKKQRRREGREAGRRRAPIITEAEFLARRESVERVMVVRQRGDRTQIAVLEDGVLVEHYVTRSTAQSFAGNVYLGRVQNVLPSMEAAFVDIGRGRNAVLYAGEVNWDSAGLDGQPKRIEHALKSGESVMVQVTKDPLGHKGARLTSQISLPGRFLVYVPDGAMTGISRKLPDIERTRLKQILKKVLPENAGVIVRTASEGATEEQLSRDVTRLQAQWEDIQKKAKTASAPSLLYSEPDLTIRVIRDVFNEDFSKVVVAGEDAWDVVEAYVGHVAPDLADRLERWTADDDVFAAHRIDEQLAKALDRKVWLPSGGSLVIDRTEAMVVIDVNTGKFTGKGGNLEETVTKNNLEAAEEIVRQLRLRDLGGIIVIDFIDMVLESNRDLVLRRLLECLGRDRTKHQVAEVTSLGLVQMTRKRVGQGLLEAFSEPCESCNGRGIHVHMEPVESKPGKPENGERDRDDRPVRRKRGQRTSRPESERESEPAAAAVQDVELEPVGS
jgi:ribonuclease E